MPLYEFEIFKPRTGEVVERFDVPLPVEERDNLALLRPAPRGTQIRRAQLPRTLAIAGSAQNPSDNATLRVLHRAECRHGSTSDFYRRIGFTPEEYKQTWRNHSSKETPDEE